MTKPKVSIIIPAYNAQKYIEKCLNSVINQTFKDIEVIIVNDGSTDDTQKIVENFQKTDDRIILINQENKRQGGARNTGFKIAKGQYIAYLDSDDAIEPDYIKALYEAITKYNADIANSQFKFIKKGKEKYGIKFKKTRFIDDKKEILKVLKIPPYWNCHARMYRKELLDDISFEENTFFEDIEYLVKILSKDISVVVVKEADYNYILNNDSTASPATGSEKKTRERFKAALKSVQLMQKTKVPIKDFYVYKEKKSIFRIRHYNDKAKWYFLGIPFFVEHKPIDIEKCLKLNSLEQV